MAPRATRCGSPGGLPASSPLRQESTARTWRVAWTQGRYGLRPARSTPVPGPGRRDLFGPGRGGVPGLRRHRRCDPRGAAVSGRPARGAPDGAPLRHRNRTLRAVWTARAGPASAADLRRPRPASVQLGPGVATLAVQMHTEVGVPLAKLAKLLQTTFGLQVTPGGLVHLLHRVARDAAPLYALPREQVRHSPVVVPDETGWRSAPSATGCGSSPPRKRRSKPSAPAAASTTPPRCSNPTSTAYWCATGGCVVELEEVVISEVPSTGCRRPC